MIKMKIKKNRYIIGIVISLTLLLAISITTAVTTKQSYAEPNDLNTQIAQTQKELDEASRDYGDALMAQEEAERNVKNAKEELQNIEKELTKTHDRLAFRVKHMYVNNESLVG